MKTYIDRRPPGWEKMPEHPVFIVIGDEEAEVRKPLYAFSDFWRRVRQKAERILIMHPSAARVDICAASGEVLCTVHRDLPMTEARGQGIGRH